MIQNLNLIYCLIMFIVCEDTLCICKSFREKIIWNCWNRLFFVELYFITHHIINFLLMSINNELLIIMNIIKFMIGFSKYKML